MERFIRFIDYEEGTLRSRGGGVMERFIRFIDYEEGTLRYVPLFPQGTYGIREERVRAEESPQELVSLYLVCISPGKDYEVILADFYDERAAGLCLSRFMRLVVKPRVEIIDVPSIVRKLAGPAETEDDPAETEAPEACCGCNHDTLLHDCRRRIAGGRS